MWLKGCLKCHGDLYENVDYYGRYVTCMQCGHHIIDVEEITLCIPLGERTLVKDEISIQPDVDLASEYLIPVG